MRIPLLLLALLAVAIAIHGFMTRGRIERRLQQALAVLDQQPKSAYEILRPVLSMGGVASFGRADDACERLLQAMLERVTIRLNAAAPSEADVRYARDVLETLDFLRRHEPGDRTETVRRRVLMDLRAAADRIRDHGTLAAWDELLSVFHALADAGRAPTDGMPDFADWLRTQDQMPRRELGLRQAVSRARLALRQGLGVLGIDPPADGPFVAPIPPNLHDLQYVNAERFFRDMARAVVDFLAPFEPEAIPAHVRSTAPLTELQRDAIVDALASPEAPAPSLPDGLLPLLAVAHFNRAALKLAHAQDRGPLLRRAGSGFLVELFVVPETPRVPTPAEMTEAFFASARAQLLAAARDFAAASKTDRQLAPFLDLARESLDQLERERIAGGSSAGDASPPPRARIVIRLPAPPE